MDDPYQILGLKRDATADDIRAAYRKLAKKHHPDLNPGDKSAEETFKTISGAHDLLADPEKRGKFDRGEIDATGAPRHSERQYYRDYADDGGRTKYRTNPAGNAGVDPDDLESFFSQAFGGRGFAGGRPTPPANRHYTLSVDFLDAANGATKRLTLPDGKVLDVTIPPGLRDGQTLRLKGKGEPARNGAQAGDALIEVSVAPHRLFRREGDDVIIEVNMSLREAVLGAKIQVPTIKGPINVNIPAHTAPGTRLRLKGRGIGQGHQFVELKLVLPTGPEPALEAFLEQWKPVHEFDPRAGLLDP